VTLSASGALDGERRVVNSSTNPLFPALTASALEAITRCTPLHVPKSPSAKF
jgi:hypothetical protein